MMLRTPLLTKPSVLALEYPFRGLPCFVQGSDKVVRGDALQNVERLKGGGRWTRQTHHDALGILSQGGIDQLLHHEGGAVVHVDSA